MAFGDRRDALHLRAGHDAARRVARRTEKQRARPRRYGAFDSFGRRDEPVLFRRRQVDGDAVVLRDLVEVRREAGFGRDDFVAGFEKRLEREVERLDAARHDEHLVGRRFQAVAPVPVGADGLPDVLVPLDRGVVGVSGLRRPGGLVDDVGLGVKVGLPDAERDDVRVRRGDLKDLLYLRRFDFSVLSRNFHGIRSFCPICANVTLAKQYRITGGGNASPFFRVPPRERAMLSGRTVAARAPGVSYEKKYPPEKEEGRGARERREREDPAVL